MQHNSLSLAGYRGTGDGIGTKPVTTNWTKGLVSNVCPECGYGAIDLDSNGDGRWKIEWLASAKAPVIGLPLWPLHDCFSHALRPLHFWNF